MMSDEIEGTSNEIKEMSVDVDAILNSLRTKNDEYLRVSQESQTKKVTSYTIHRVPEEMWVGGADSSRYFVPKIVSIGPVHRGRRDLERGEVDKWKCILKLFRSNEESVGKIIKDFSSSMVTEAKNSYEEQLVDYLSNEDLGQIMVLDGFFIIETFLLASFGIGSHDERLRQDFLLLENQIPFPVLQCLYDSIRTEYEDYRRVESDDVEDLKVLARRYLFWPREVASCGPIPDRVHHLLHLFHSSLLPPSPEHEFPKKNSCSWYRSVSFSDYIIKEAVSPRKPLQSATQLLEDGVKFRKTTKKNAGRSSMIDVRFRRGYIEIPLLSLESSTVSLLLNLLAFEKCNPECGNHVTVYMAFMNCLINTAKDVDLLVSCGVLENKLGSDEDVAHFFNTACDDKFPYRKFEEGNYLFILLIDLEAYCAEPRHRNYAKLKRDYLSSPWSIISLIAGIVLLILTVVQTYMAVYSYFIPPKSGG